MTRASAVTLRDARRDEVPLIVAMLADDVLGATREQPGDPLPQGYYDGFDAIAASPDNRLLLAELDGEVVGTLHITFIPGIARRGAAKMLIEEVRVASARRGSGVGAGMIAAAIALARARRCRTVELTSNNLRTDAHRFYARLGFVASHVGMKLALD